MLENELWCSVLDEVWLYTKLRMRQTQLGVREVI
jgi:hypothetical protein